MFKVHYLLASIILCSCFITTLHAQHGNGNHEGKEFINESRIDLNGIKSKAKIKLQTLTSVSIHKSVHVVRLIQYLYKENKLILYVNRNNKRLSFSKNNEAEKIQIIKNEIEVISDNQYVWKGNVFHHSLKDPIGTAIFVQNNDGQINGNIEVEGVTFQIHPLAKSGLHAIIEFDDTELERQDAVRSKNSSSNRYGSGSTTVNKGTVQYFHNIIDNNFSGDYLNKLQLQPKSEISSSCSMRYIRAMVLYTPEAANYGNIENIIALAISETNQAYTNSGITDVNLVLQHSQEFDFGEGDNIQYALNDRLIPNLEIKALRDLHKADVVIMLTGAGTYIRDDDVGGECNTQNCQDHPDGHDKSEEWGIAGTLLLDSERAYAIVDVSKATGPTYTLAHELGHLQAARHHPDEDNEPNPVYSYGYGHRISYSCGFFNWSTCRRSTIMAWTIPGVEDKHINFFSTPYKTYNGKTLGIANERDNRRALNSSRNIVSNFRDANEPSASISYSRGIVYDYGQNFTFNSTTCGGNGSITYQWSKSYASPNNFGGVESSSSSWFVTLSPGIWYVKLTVHTSTGQSSSKVISVSVDDDDDDEGEQPCLPGIICEDPGGPILKTMNPEIDNNTDLLDEYALLPAYPNPFNPNTQIAFKVPTSQNVSIVVYDMAGRVLKQLTNRRYEAGQYQVTFNASEYSSGNYLIRMHAGEYIQTQTITLVK